MLPMLALLLYAPLPVVFHPCMLLKFRARPQQFALRFAVCAPYSVLLEKASPLRDNDGWPDIQDQEKCGSTLAHLHDRVNFSPHELNRSDFSRPHHTFVLLAARYQPNSGGARVMI